MMLVNIADVVLRYTLSAPLPSSYELTQFCMVVIVYGGIAWCGLVGGHVALDLLGERLDRPGLGWLNASVRATSALLLFIVAWRSGLAAAEYYASGETSNMLRWPLYPFLAVTAAGAGLYGLILTMQAMNAWRASEQHDPEPMKPMTPTVAGVIRHARPIRAACAQDAGRPGDAGGRRCGLRRLAGLAGGALYPRPDAVRIQPHRRSLGDPVVRADGKPVQRLGREPRSVSLCPCAGRALARRARLGNGGRLCGLCGGVRIESRYRGHPRSRGLARNGALSLQPPPCHRCSGGGGDLWAFLFRPRPASSSTRCSPSNPSASCFSPASCRACC